MQPSLHLQNFGFSISSKDLNLDLIEFTRKFPIDLKIKKDRDGFPRIYHRDGNDPLTHKARIVGEVKKRIGREALGEPLPGYQTITYPYGNRRLSFPTGPKKGGEGLPSPLLIGVYCTYCRETGPNFHDPTCRDYSKQSLYLTLKGFQQIALLYNEDYELECDKHNSKSCKTCTANKCSRHKLNMCKFCLLQNYLARVNNPNVFQEIKKAFKDYPNYDDVYNSDLDNNDIALNFKCIDFGILRDEKPIKPFSGCALISYLTPNGKNIGIRVYSKTIIILSCPWTEQDFFLSFIQHAKLDHYLFEFDFNSAQAFFALTDKEIDLKTLYNYLSNIPNKIETNNHRYPFIPHAGYLFKYELNFARTNITMKLLIYTLDYINTGYKVTCTFRKGGNVGLHMAFCKNTESDPICEDPPEFISLPFDDMLNNIERVFIRTFAMLLSYLGSFLETYSEALTDKIADNKIIVNTVPGNYPYVKTGRFKENEPVKIFDKNEYLRSNTHNHLDYWRDGGYYVKKAKEKGDVVVRLEGKNITLPEKFIKKLNDHNTSQVSGPKGKRPSPYTFTGTCPEPGKVPEIGGRMGRDGLYYPTCVKNSKSLPNNISTQKNKERVREYIIKGFPLDDGEANEYDIDVDVEYDYMSGVLIPGTNEIGNVVEILDPETNKDYIQVKIKNTKNTNIDNITMLQYTVVVLDDAGNETDRVYKNIYGYHFHPRYRVNRYIPGIGREPQNVQKDILLGIAKKLNLVKTGPFENATRGGNIVDLVDDRWPPKLLSLIPKKMEEFTKYPYGVCVIPQDSIYVLLIIHNNRSYLINETREVAPTIVQVRGYTNIKVIGFLLENTLYPCDILSNDDYRVRIQHLNTIVQNMVSSQLRIENPRNYILPFPGIGDHNLPEATRELLRENTYQPMILFTPLYRGKGKRLLWKGYQNIPIVVQLIRSVANTKWIVGYYDSHGEPHYFDLIGEKEIPLEVKGLRRGNYIRVTLHFDTSGGLHRESPLIFQGIASIDEAMSYNKTNLIINSLVHPIPLQTFHDIEHPGGIAWKIYDPIMTLVPQRDTMGETLLRRI